MYGVTHTLSGAEATRLSTQITDGALTFKRFSSHVEHVRGLIITTFLRVHAALTARCVCAKQQFIYLNV